MKLLPFSLLLFRRFFRQSTENTFIRRTLNESNQKRNEFLNFGSELPQRTLITNEKLCEETTITSVAGKANRKVVVKISYLFRSQRIPGHVKNHLRYKIFSNIKPIIRD
jgi:hypothetical protein